MTQNYLVNKNVTVLAWKSDSGEDGKPGYNVKDEAGNVTWQSEEEFLKNHLPLGHYDGMAPHVQRMVIEKAQLTHRLTGLRAFLFKVDGGEKPEGLSDDDVQLMVAQRNHMEGYDSDLGSRIRRATERRLVGKRLPLIDGHINTFAVGEGVAPDVADSVKLIRVAKVYTADGLELSHDLSYTKQVEGQRTMNMTLSLPGGQDIYFKLDPERAVLSISKPSSITTELFFDLEVVLENYNCR